MAGIRIPNLSPRVGQDPQHSVQNEAPRVLPQQNFQPQQTEQLGQSLAQGGAGLARVGDYLTDVYDDAKATTWKNEYREAAGNLLNKAASLRGMAAVDQLPAIQQELDALRQGFDEKFENENQRRMFSEFADDAQAKSHVALDGMLREHTVVAYIGAQTAATKAEVRAYQRDWNDAKKAAEHKANALVALAKRAEAEGWNNQTLDNEILLATNEMHTGVLDSLRQNSGEMRKYLDANAKEMLPDSVNTARRVLAESSDNEVAVDFHMKAVEIAAKKGGSLAEQQAFAEATLTASYKGKRLTADQYLKAQRLIKAGYMEQRDLDAQLTRDAVTRAEKVLADNPNLGVAALDAKDVERIKAGGAWGAVTRFANTGRYVTDPEGFAVIASFTAEQHRAMPEAEFLQRIEAVASKQGQAQLLAMRRLHMGSASQKSAARSFLSADNRLESIGMKALQFDTRGKSVTLEQQRIELDDWKAAAQDRYQEFLQTGGGTGKAALPDTEDNRWMWLRKEEAKTLLNASGESVSLFGLPPSEWRDQYLRFQGRLIKHSQLPDTVVGSYRGERRAFTPDEMADMFTETFNREPTMPELGIYLDAFVANLPLPTTPEQLAPPASPPPAFPDWNNASWNKPAWRR